MDRRHVAVGCALAGVAIALTFALVTYLCGVRSVGEICTSAADCAAKSSCVSYLHPMAIPYVLLALAGVALAWMRLAYPLLVMGALGTLVGIAFGMSMGLAGIGVGVLVLAAGVALLGRPGATSAKDG